MLIIAQITSITMNPCGTIFAITSTVQTGQETELIASVLSFGVSGLNIFLIKIQRAFSVSKL
jgi:hypothetical protein